MSYKADGAEGANGIVIAVNAWVVPGWREIQEVTWPLRGTDASEKVMADTGERIPEELLNLASMRALIVAKIPPPLPGITLERLASNDGSDIPYPQANRALARLPPLRSPVWVSYGRSVYDVTCEYNWTNLEVCRIRHTNKRCSALVVWRRSPAECHSPPQGTGDPDGRTFCFAGAGALSPHNWRAGAKKKAGRRGCRKQAGPPSRGAITIEAPAAMGCGPLKWYARTSEHFEDVPRA